MKVTDAEFVNMLLQFGPTETAHKLGVTDRRVYMRRSQIEKETGEPIDVPRGKREFTPSQVAGRLHLEVLNGVVLVAGDAHYWPGIVSTAHRALVHACKLYHPKAVIMNGDVFDGAGISRHAPIAWESRPSVIQEIEACKERLDEIKSAAVNAKLYWPLGNHDARFESRLASIAPEYAKVHGVHLQDHFPEWWPCWSVWINDCAVVKHRYKGGTHATHNNTASSGKTMITNHLHSQKVTPYTDYNGDRWGVDTGTLAEPFGPQFQAYCEDNPVNWRSGFAMLTFERGRLLQPELIRVVEPGVVDFRGKLWNVP